MGVASGRKHAWPRPPPAARRAAHETAQASARDRLIERLGGRLGRVATACGREAVDRPLHGREIRGGRLPDLERHVAEVAERARGEVLVGRHRHAEITHAAIERGRDLDTELPADLADGRAHAARDVDEEEHVGDRAVGHGWVAAFVDESVAVLVDAGVALVDAGTDRADARAEGGAVRRHAARRDAAPAAAHAGHASERLAARGSRSRPRHRSCRCSPPRRRRRSRRRGRCRRSRGWGRRRLRRRRTRSCHPAPRHSETRRHGRRRHPPCPRATRRSGSRSSRWSRRRDSRSPRRRDHRSPRRRPRRPRGWAAPSPRTCPSCRTHHRARTAGCRSCTRRGLRGADRRRSRPVARRPRTHSRRRRRRRDPRRCRRRRARRLDQHPPRCRRPCRRRSHRLLPCPRRRRSVRCGCAGPRWPHRHRPRVRAARGT
jgi:hypothetical protein